MSRPVFTTTEALVALPLELIERALAETATPHPMTEHLDGIRELVGGNATIFHVHELLKATYPAPHEDPAGAKLHVVHTLTGEQIERLEFTDERSHYSAYFENGSWLDGRLLLLGLASFKYHRFLRIEENGGYFVNQLKRSANPGIIEKLRTWRGNATTLVDEQVWEVVAELYRQEIDVRVEVGFTRRAYNGTRSNDTTSFQVVGHRHPTSGE